MRTPIRLVALATVVSLAAACGGGSSSNGTAGGTLRVSGSTTVGPVAADAATALRAEQNLTITIDTQGGSAGGITQLGMGQIDVGLSSKPIADTDKAQFPEVDFVATQIGEDAVGIVVRKEVIEGGLTSITHDQLRDLFEGKVTNWKQIGGPDLKTFVYDKEPGRGTREVLDKYLYGKGVKAPAPPTDNPAYAIVGGNQETRTKLLSTEGSVAPLSSAFADGQPTLGVLAVGGVLPTAATIIDKTYPMSRPLYVLTDGQPTGNAKVFVDYLLSDEGQKLVTKNGYLTNAQLKA